MAFNWTHDPLVAEVTLIHAVDYTELQNAVDTVRSKAGLSAISNWLSILPGNKIKTSETEQIRNAIDDIDPNTAGCTSHVITDQNSQFTSHVDVDCSSHHASFPNVDDSSYCPSNRGGNRSPQNTSINGSYYCPSEY